MNVAHVHVLLLIVLCIPSSVVGQVKKDDVDAAARLKSGAAIATVNSEGNIAELAIAMNYGDDPLPMTKLLKSLCSLEKLTIGGCSDESLSLVAEIDTIRDLTIYSHELTDNGLDSLGKMSALRTLSITSTANLSPEGLENLGKLTELRDLTLFTLTANDDTLMELCNCTHIETLQFVEPNITNEGLKLSLIHI